MPPDRARVLARLSEGSIGRALGFLPQDDSPGPWEAIRIEARSLLEAALSQDPADRIVAAQAQAPAGARGYFASVLQSLTVWIRDLAAAAAGADDSIINVDSREWLLRAAQKHPGSGPGAAAAIRLVDAAGELGQFNVNPQLTVAWLIRSLARELAAS
jgi:hypothetical protein